MNPEDDCIIAVPCFSGRVPPAIAERVASLKGSGARTLVLVSFGNRGWEDSLLELTDLAAAAGFHVVGAAAVVSQHSLAPACGAGRPTGGDLTAVADLARRVAAYTGTGTVRPNGHRPYRPYNRLGYAPGAGPACISCMACADACPAGAIQRRPGTPADINKCMGCLTCVVRCPQRCRQLPAAVSAEIGAKLAVAASGRERSAFFFAE